MRAWRLSSIASQKAHFVLRIRFLTPCWWSSMGYLFKVSCCNTKKITVWCGLCVFYLRSISYILKVWLTGELKKRERERPCCLLCGYNWHIHTHISIVSAHTHTHTLRARLCTLSVMSRRKRPAIIRCVVFRERYAFHLFYTLLRTTSVCVSSFIRSLRWWWWW